MLFKEVKGDLFKVNTNKWVLARCISADVTAIQNMNKGIAKLFHEKFPKMAEKISPYLQTGTAAIYQIGNNVIYNLIPKEKVWQKAIEEYKNPYYTQLKQSLINLRDQMIKNNENYLAMPRISSGLDGANWDEIREIIKCIFCDTNIEIQIRYIDEPVQIGNIRYNIEKAKTDRSTYRRCKKSIKKDNMRLVESIPKGSYTKKR